MIARLTFSIKTAVTFFLMLTSIIVSNFAYAENKPLQLILDWFPNPDHAPIFVAQEQGFFKQQGLDVHIVGPADPSDPSKLVAAGKADIALTYQPQLMLAVAQGLPLVRFATLVNSPLTCLVVNQNGPIVSIRDLKGKTIASSDAGVAHVILDTMLKYNGLSLKDVNVISVHYDLTQALLSHKVDAVTGMMRNFELIQMQLAGAPGRAFYPEKNGVPAYDELVFVTNKNEANDPRLKKFVLALIEATAYLKKHPELCWQAFAKVHPELDNELNKKAWFASLGYFDDHPGDLDVQRYSKFEHFLYTHGLMTKLLATQHYAQATSVKG